LLWLVNCADGNDGTLWLVRHGETAWNAAGLVQGHADEPELTIRGRQQAERVAECLRDRPIRAIYASDLRRTRQSAEILEATLGTPVVYDRSLRERSFGTHEGLPLHSLTTEDTGISGDHVVDVEARPTGGESLTDVYRRVGTFVEWLRSQQHQGDVVVVAHGGSIRAMRAYCEGVAVQQMPWRPVPNGSVWIVGQPAVSRTLKHR
jgi:broad specificity phosphatase PhoE